MRSTGIIFFILLLIVSCDTERSFSVPEENYFVKFYGEEGEQEGVDFVLNPDGTIVMVGNTERPGVLSQIYVVKVDANGHELWNKKFGLPDKNDWVKDVELHPDGRIVIVGETEMGVGNRDVFLFSISQDGARLDSIRVALKTKLFQDTNEEPNSVSIISDGFIVSGATTLTTNGILGSKLTRGAMHLRFDNSLQKYTDPWNEVFGTEGSDNIAIRILEIIPDSVFFVFGYTNSSIIQGGSNTLNYDFWISQRGSGGGPSSVDLTFGDDTSDEFLSSVQIDKDQFSSGYILTGTSVRSSGFSQTYLVKTTKTDDLGSTSERFNSSPTDLAQGIIGRVGTVIQIDGNLFLTSNDYNNQNLGSNISLTKLSREFSKINLPLIFGGEGDDFAGSVAELPNGRILLMGTMTVGQSSTIGQKKMVLMKLNSEGKLAE